MKRYTAGMEDRGKSDKKQIQELNHRLAALHQVNEQMRTRLEAMRNLKLEHRKRFKELDERFKKQQRLMESSVYLVRHFCSVTHSLDAVFTLRPCCALLFCCLPSFHSHVPPWWTTAVGGTNAAPSHSHGLRSKGQRRLNPLCRRLSPHFSLPLLLPLFLRCRLAYLGYPAREPPLTLRLNPLLANRHSKGRYDYYFYFCSSPTLSLYVLHSFSLDSRWHCQASQRKREERLHAFSLFFCTAAALSRMMMPYTTVFVINKGIFEN